MAPERLRGVLDGREVLTMIDRDSDTCGGGAGETQTGTGWLSNRPRVLTGLRGLLAAVPDQHDPQRPALQHGYPFRRVRLGRIEATTATAAAARVTHRDSAAARRTSATSGRGPSPRVPRSSTASPYEFVPPSVTPSAPAKDASTGPAFGLGCLPASRRQARTASRGLPETTAVSAAQTRAGT